MPVQLAFWLFLGGIWLYGFVVGYFYAKDH